MKRELSPTKIEEQVNIHLTDKEIDPNQFGFDETVPGP